MTSGESRTHWHIRFFLQLFQEYHTKINDNYPQKIIYRRNRTEFSKTVRLYFPRLNFQKRQTPGIGEQIKHYFFTSFTYQHDLCLLADNSDASLLLVQACGSNWITRATVYGRTIIITTNTAVTLLRYYSLPSQTVARPPIRRFLYAVLFPRSRRAFRSLHVIQYNIDVPLPLTPNFSHRNPTQEK